VKAASKIGSKTFINARKLALAVDGTWRDNDYNDQIGPLLGYLKPFLAMCPPDFDFAKNLAFAVVRSVDGLKAQGVHSDFHALKTEFRGITWGHLLVDEAEIKAAADPRIVDGGDAELIPALLNTNVLGKYMASRGRAVHSKLTELGATCEFDLQLPPVAEFGLQEVAKYDEAEWKAFKSDFSEVLDIGRAARPLLDLLCVPNLDTPGLDLGLKPEVLFDGFVSIVKSEADAFLA
jgi:hypothetical protein